MSTTLAAEWHVDEPQLRVTAGDARAALRAVTGKPVIPARARLRFGPGRTCEEIARLLDRAIVRVEAAGLDPGLLVVADGSAEAGRTSSGCGVRPTGWRTGFTARRAGSASSCARPGYTRPGSIRRARPPGLPGSRPRIRWHRPLPASPPNPPWRLPPCATRWPRSSTPTSA